MSYQKTEHQMFCPICKKNWKTNAINIGGVSTNEEGRLILPCDIHTQEERHLNFLQDRGYSGKKLESKMEQFKKKWVVKN